MSFDVRLTKIRLVVLDVDGVLSDGSIVISQTGELFKSFNVRDGLGIKLLQRAGIEVAILTGRTSEIVARRAAELGIRQVEQGKLEKRPTLLRMLEALDIRPDELAYMGDDLPDLPCLRVAGFAATPKNGSDALTPYVHWRSSFDGGRGAVRELAERILKAQGKWDELVASLYLSQGQ
ncbi:HAD-IIIA family hydrolase [Sutterella massiliensis]|uniref:HAD-IIIA family hydrolase n=1 Tax=Sutterella massiliensis TaxID=1816689 RepID=A0ABS2DNS4_9BURK|nr:HAD-IIIA family hydrolase [Sutterella massiliensis]MBM6702984.1 HAD-IIIA family hydrolase [Sutterella massiliensis]